MVNDERQGWALFAVMGILLFIGVMTVYWSESHGNPAFAAFDVDSTPGAFQAGGNMEGKEVRFGITPSSLFATVTTDAGGAVDAMHDSFLPLGGMVLFVNMALGEVTFGGVGSGLYGMLAFAIVTMFVAGLMVGRTPEYLGKKLEAREVKMTILALLSYSLSILGWTALSAAVPQGLAGIANSGPHGFTEILYAFASATGNNGSSFAGLSANTVFYNMTLAAAMLMGRFIYVIPLLAVAGALAQKKRVPPVGRVGSNAQPAICGITRGRRADHGRARLFPRRYARTGDRAGGDEPRHPLSGSLIITRRRQVDLS
jgi:K+-transporting ATPase ATPase A chain